MIRRRQPRISVVCYPVVCYHVTMRECARKEKQSAISVRRRVFYLRADARLILGEPRGGETDQGMRVTRVRTRHAHSSFLSRTRSVPSHTRPRHLRTYVHRYVHTTADFRACHVSVARHARAPTEMCTCRSGSPGAVFTDTDRTAIRERLSAAKRELPGN